jgi:uncharacterized membrane protein YhaH (DUF805 family)
MPNFVSRIERYARFALHPRHRFTLSELANPRGRCSRQGFLMVAIGLIAVQLLLAVVLAIANISLTGGASLAVNLVIFGLGLSACVQRLHDLDKRAWVIPAAVAGWFAVTFVAALVLFMLTDDGFMKEGSIGYAIVFAMMMIPAFGGLLWLHTAPGQTVDNRFGPVPGRNGFAKAPKALRVSRAARPAPEMSGAVMA